MRKMNEKAQHIISFIEINDIHYANNELNFVCSYTNR